MKAVKVLAIVPRLEAGPLAFVGGGYNCLLRPFRADGDRLAGEQPAGDGLADASLDEQYELRALQLEFAADADRDAGVGEIERVLLLGKGVRTRDLLVMIRERTAQIQAEQHVDVAGAGRGVVVIDPPRTPRSHDAVLPHQGLETEMIAAPAPPAAGVLIEGFEIGARSGLCHAQTVGGAVGRVEQPVNRGPGFRPVESETRKR